ncbi:HNH endonuclease [Leptospira dzoumogneensis]
MYNMRVIRGRLYMVLYYANSIEEDRKKVGSDSLRSMSMHSEFLTESYNEYYALKTHHRNFILRIRETYSYMEKEYNQKTFPPALRDHIFQRDNYTCQRCGISREQTIARGYRLEVTHKIHPKEGGSTSFANGETICSECRIGKQQAEKQKIGSRKRRRLSKV